MSTASVRGRLVALLDPVVTAAGYDLEDLAVTPAGRRRVVRVVVDRDGGVDLDGVADLSRALSQALDVSDALGPAPYVLEVTSPGVDRPLTRPRHWRRAVGRVVRVSLRGSGPVVGRVTHATGETVSVDTEHGPRTLALEDVTRGVVQVEFARLGEEASA
jgi:ribosome maturation factor RimP